MIIQANFEYPEYDKKLIYEKIPKIPSKNYSHSQNQINIKYSYLFAPACL